MLNNQYCIVRDRPSWPGDTRTKMYIMYYPNVITDSNLNLNLQEEEESCMKQNAWWGRCIRGPTFPPPRIFAFFFLIFSRSSPTCHIFRASPPTSHILIHPPPWCACQDVCERVHMETRRDENMMLCIVG